MKNESYFIKDFPDYRLVRLSERDFCVLSKRKKGYWEEIGTDKGDGHIRVTLYNKDVKRYTTLHTIVAEMFVPNPEGKTVVHHIDGDATNNDPVNLMWVTPSEHGELHKKGEKNPMYGRTGDKNPMYGKPKPEGSGLQPRPVEQWSLDGTTLIARYASTMESSRMSNIAQSSISSCCNGKRSSAGGYKWKYC